MLILTRKIGEAIKINDDITITNLGSSHGNVKLGIDAPENIPVHREEIYNKIMEEKNLHGKNENLKQEV